MTQAEINRGINILKRVIERLSTELPMTYTRDVAEKSQQDALNIANCAIEQLFGESAE